MFLYSGQGSISIIGPARKLNKKYVYICREILPESATGAVILRVGVIADFARLHFFSASNKDYIKGLNEGICVLMPPPHPRTPLAPHDKTKILNANCTLNPQVKARTFNKTLNKNSLWYAAQAHRARPHHTEDQRRESSHPNKKWKFSCSSKKTYLLEKILVMRGLSGCSDYIFYPHQLTHKLLNEYPVLKSK